MAYGCFENFGSFGMYRAIISSEGSSKNYQNDAHQTEEATDSFGTVQTTIKLTDNNHCVAYFDLYG